MSPGFTEEEIRAGLTRRARSLFRLAMGIDGTEALNEQWDALSEVEQENWVKMATAVKGPIHREDGAGPYPTAPQADKLRSLVKNIEEQRKVMRVESWMVQETRPYADMVLRIEVDGLGSQPPLVWLIRVNGEEEQMHSEAVAHVQLGDR
jgi:hypothetical protein